MVSPFVFDLSWWNLVDDSVIVRPIYKIVDERIDFGYAYKLVMIKRQLEFELSI